MLFAGLEYSEQIPQERLESTTTVIHDRPLACSIRDLASVSRRNRVALRSLFSGGKSLPPLSVSDFLPIQNSLGLFVAW